jgi:hypothetical protein
MRVSQSKLETFAIRPFEHQVYMKMAVFWDVALYSLVDTDWCFRGAFFLHHQSDESLYDPDGVGSKLLWNVSWYLPDYTVIYPSRQPSSYLLLWEPQIQHWVYMFLFLKYNSSLFHLKTNRMIYCNVIVMSEIL